MGHVDLEDFKQVLETMLAGLERRLLRRDGIAIEHTPDALDEVQYAADREFAVRQLEQDSVRFRDVNAALRRIEEGSYGACLHCGSAISIKRLNAVPWTPCCIDCQDVSDQTTVEAEQGMLPLTQRGPKAMLAGPACVLGRVCLLGRTLRFVHAGGSNRQRPDAGGEFSVRELGNGKRKYRLQWIYPHVKNPGNATHSD